MSHQCPRRSELSDRLNEQFPGPDEYLDGRGLVNGFFPGCSHCGSVSGDDFMAYVRSGGEVVGTDKNYKAYLERDTRTPHASEDYEFETADGRVIHGTRTVQGTGTQHGKFYYQHLSVEQRTEFVDLYNAGKINHSIYVWPFFMGAA